MTFKTLDQLSGIEGKTALVRADLNVPMKEGSVTDDTRLTRLIPTIKDLSSKGAKVVLLSHFGRPKGQRVPDMSLAPVAQTLGRLMDTPVAFTEDCIGETAQNAINALDNGGIIVLENTRYHAGEEKNDMAFAQALAALGDIYINDAFSAAHRAHASTEALARCLPAYAGRLMEAELNALGAALETPQRPVVAIVGGAKISTKIDLLNNLVTKIDTLVLGGGMANTFLFAQGKDLGKSLCEQDMAETARAIMQTAEKNNCRILLPTDVVTAKEFAPNPPTETKPSDNIAADDLALDIGTQSVAEISSVLESAKTLLWNGPVGAFETAPFDGATLALAQKASDLTQTAGLISVAGGGDTVAALAKANAVESMTYVSTAGGAFLEWLEGKTLPGVAALNQEDSCGTSAACG